MRPQFWIELIGGPDDGAVYQVDHFPEIWEMTYAAHALACTLLGMRESKVVRYYRADEINEKGHVLYYYENLQEMGVAV